MVERAREQGGCIFLIRNGGTPLCLLHSIHSRSGTRLAQWHCILSLAACTCCLHGCAQSFLHIHASNMHRRLLSHMQQRHTSMCRMCSIKVRHHRLPSSKVATLSTPRPCSSCTRSMASAWGCKMHAGRGRQLCDILISCLLQVVWPCSSCTHSLASVWGCKMRAGRGRQLRDIMIRCLLQAVWPCSSCAPSMSSAWGCKERMQSKDNVWFGHYSRM